MSCCRWCSTTVRRYRSSILWRRRRRFWPLRVSLARIGERGRLGPPRYSSFSSTRARRLSNVALSPPPENLEGGMEVNVIYREIFTDLLRRQLEAAIPPKESRGFWRGLFGR